MAQDQQGQEAASLPAVPTIVNNENGSGGTSSLTTPPAESPALGSTTAPAQPVGAAVTTPAEVSATISDTGLPSATITDSSTDATVQAPSTTNAVGGTNAMPAGTAPAGAAVETNTTAAVGNTESSTVAPSTSSAGAPKEAVAASPPASEITPAASAPVSGAGVETQSIAKVASATPQTSTTPTTAPPASGPSSSPPPPANMAIMPILRGQYEINVATGKVTFTGSWAMSTASMQKGEVSSFEYSCNLPTDYSTNVGNDGGAAEPPYSGQYNGRFFMDPPDRKGFWVAENGVTLSFTSIPNDPSTYNCNGNGTNAYGSFRVQGQLQTNTSTLVLYKHYPPVQVDAAKALEKERKRQRRREQERRRKAERAKAAAAAGAGVVPAALKTQIGLGIPLRRQSSQREKRKSTKLLHAQGKSLIAGSEGSRVPLPPLLKSLRQKIKSIMSIGYIQLFFRDRVPEEIPKYYEVIKHPMWLRKILSRLDSGHYTPQGWNDFMDKKPGLEKSGKKQGAATVRDESVDQSIAYTVLLSLFSSLFCICSRCSRLLDCLLFSCVSVR